MRGKSRFHFLVTLFLTGTGCLLLKRVYIKEVSRMERLMEKEPLFMENPKLPLKVNGEKAFLWKALFKIVTLNF